VKRFLEHFIEEGKPIGLISLGEVPVRTILKQEIEIASPPYDPDRLAVDAERRIIHTPGFSTFTRLQDVQRGIRAMVSELLRLMGERNRQLVKNENARSREEK
jgi:enhancing lycopene biosynthesis protein 2